MSSNSMFARLIGRFVHGEGMINGIRAQVNLLDSVEERAWELRQANLNTTVSDGEMTAILRRNGLPGFHQYVFGQMVGRFGRRSYIPGDFGRIAQELQQNHPEECARIIQQADQVCSGHFRLLGSPVRDMRRRFARAGHKIDWRRDVISGERYQKVFSNWRWNPMAFRPGHADVKGPWELTRCQHFPLLGLAYRLTGDEKYAQCFARTIRDFVKKNPVGNGVHWACTMDVALRVVSWCQGASLFQGSKSLTYGWWRMYLKSLVLHGRFISQTLEFGTLDGKIIVSNHGLANLFGLYWLSLNYPGLDAGCVWRGIAETGLENQIQNQVLDDGGCFESSIPYHRLVMEIFLSAYALGQHHRLSFSPEYKQRLIEGLRFTRSLRQPAGRWPQVGDADNGRAHVFSGYGIWEDQQESMDHLLVAAATVFDAPDLAEGISGAALVEGCLWRDPGDPSPEPLELKPLAGSTAFPQSGLAVLRNGPSYLALSNSVCGTYGIGNHKHNDQLSIEWCVDHCPVFVDGGSYTYTQDPEARNQFRSVMAHNTVSVDGAEQNGLEPEALFRLIQKGEPSLGLVETLADGSVSILAGHTAYADLEDPVEVSRRITVAPDGCVTIADSFACDGHHHFRWHFLVHPSVAVEIEGGIANLSLEDGSQWVMESSQLRWQETNGWYSPGYGTRVSTQGLVAEVESSGQQFDIRLVRAGKEP